MTDTFEAAEARALDRLKISGSLEALNDVVTLYRRAGEEDRLRDLLHRLISGSRDLEARALLFVYLGQSHERGADWPAAIDAYRQGMALEPCERFAAYFLPNNLAYCLSVRGEHAEAERLCRVAISIDPFRHNAHKNLGISLAARCDGAGAFSAWVQATLMEPGDDRALALLEGMCRRAPGLLARPGARARLEACRRAVEHRRAESEAERIARLRATGDSSFGLKELEAMVAAARARGHDALIIQKGLAGVPEVVLFDRCDAEVGDWIEFEAKDDDPRAGRVILRHKGITFLRCETCGSAGDR